MKTIIYCSSGREDKTLEQNVRLNILKQTDLPIVSVTQFPMDFGHNICVGDVGASGFNFFRQVQIALKNTDADIVISAESDCLYPPDYFEFTPPRLDVCYRTHQTYVMPDKRKFYFHKEEGATHGQWVGRLFYLDRLNTLFEGAPPWSLEEMNFPKERHKKLDIFTEIKYADIQNPVVQIKTHKGMRYHTSSDRTPIYTLPYWNDGVSFRQKYYE